MRERAYKTGGFIREENLLERGLIRERALIRERPY